MSDKMKKRTIYIGGKVSGLEVSEYIRLFKLGKEYVSMLECEDLDNTEIITPIDICEPDWTWEQSMDICVEYVKRADKVYFLPNWIDSYGAHTENYIAKVLKIHTVFIQPADFNRFLINTKKTAKTNERSY